MRTAATFARYVAINGGLHCLALGLLLGVFCITSLTTFERDPGHAAVGHSVVTSLLAGHHCWTGKAPEGAIPGHVVAMVPGGDTVYGGQALTAQALEQINGHDHGISVIAFCR